MIRTFLERYCSIQSLKRLALIITIVGALTIAIGWMLNDGSAILLIGLLLLWAGLTKLVALVLWNRLVNDDPNQQEPSIQR